ncbi:MAG: UDP-N-acetylmuramate--L-alanine ligase [Planctomycetota bacterium]|nr:UDP-N-acetylmuramate--L-alanine ligase [Planctomycetota bacterium]
MPLNSHIRQRLFQRAACAGKDRADATTAPAEIHLIGASGAGMTALSEVLLDMGCVLTGSDQSVDQTLQRQTQSPASPGRILKIHQGHDSAHLPTTADLVVFSPAISEDNLERVAAQRLGIPAVSYVEFLGELLAQSTGVCIAGTHGKTTTSAMTASILREAGVAGSAVIGGEVIQYGRSGWGRVNDSPFAESDASSLFVIEACEYRRHFLQFHPQIAAILNIEADHFDCFTTLEDVYKVFAEFAAQIHPKGKLIIRADCPLLSRLEDKCAADVETFLPVSNVSGLGRNAAAHADWAISSLREEPGQTAFDVMRQGRTFGTVELSLPGRHNVENALAAIALAHAAGVSPEAACESVSRFRGVRRRFEEIGTWDGVTLVDDYAHHPTAVQATLAAARRKYPGRRLVVAFQPHQVSRTQHLMNEFATSFGDADKVLLVPIFAARENQELAETTLGRLAECMNLAGSSVSVLASLDQLRATLEDSAQPGDVWLTLGAGNINRIPHEFARTVQRNY